MTPSSEAQTRVSIVIPAYNEGEAIDPCLGRTLDEMLDEVVPWVVDAIERGLI